MNRAVRVLLAPFLLMLAPAAADAKTVLMISIDGMNPEYVTEAGAHGLKMPNLRRFMAEGSYAASVRGVAPSVSWPSAVALMTGTPPARSGVLSNEHFEPSDRNTPPGIYLYASDVKTDTLWDAAARAGLVTANVDQLASVGSPSVRYDIPRYEPSPWPVESRKAIEAVSRPPNLLSELEGKLGTYRGVDFSRDDYDASRTAFAIEILQRYRPNFLSVHLSAVDVEAHAHGPFSPEADKAAETVDGLIGELRAAALAADPEAVVVIVSDHGQVPADTRVNLRIPLIEAGLLRIDPLTPGRAARVVDWRADLWAAGDGGILLRDPADTATRQKVREILRGLAANPANGIDRVLEEPDIAKLDGWTGASFLVTFKTGFMAGNALTGDMVAKLPKVIGMHGLLPDNPGVSASFFMAGRGVRSGRNLGRIDMLRIAPTVAEALGVRLKDAHEPALPVFLPRSD